MAAIRTLDDFVPTTFVDRGVALPFTTPGLEQTRLRLSDGEASELLVQNLSGGRGAYIMSWANVLDVMAVTLHDRLLMDALAVLAPLDPYRVREVALTIAAEGAAGRSAAEIAQQTLESDHQQMLLTQMELVVALLQEAGIEGIRLIELVSGGAAQQAQVRGTLRKLAPRLGQDPDTIFTHLEELALAIHPLGLPQSPYTSRLRRLRTSLGDLRDELTDWARTGQEDYRDAVAFIVNGLELTLAASERVIAQLDPELASSLGLLQRWIARKEQLRPRLGRCGWLLDGWEQILALWTHAAGSGPHVEREAVAEISRLIPALPKEAIEWSGLPNEQIDCQRVQRRWVKPHEDWRGKISVIDLIERNERRKAALA